MKYKKQRDAAMTLLYSKNKLSTKQLAEELSELTDTPITEKEVKFAIQAITNVNSKDL